MFHDKKALATILAARAVVVNDFGQANVAPLLPIQNHLELIYCSTQASPMLSKVMVPVPDDFHPALVTVMTISPPSPYIANVLTCPSTPAAKVATEAVVVVKYEVATARLAAADAPRASLLLLRGCNSWLVWLIVILVQLLMLSNSNS